MNWQLIITFLIIGYAVGYTLYSFVQLVRRKNSCGGGCSGCNFKRNLHRKQQINSKQFRQLKYVPKK